MLTSVNLLIIIIIILWILPTLNTWDLETPGSFSNHGVCHPEEERSGILISANPLFEFAPTFL